jgi:hypothetical protein
MKEYIIAASQVSTGYRRTTRTRGEWVDSQGKSTYGSWSTTYSTHDEEGDKIKYTWDSSRVYVGTVSGNKLYNNITNLDLYRIDLSFDTSGIPIDKVQSVKLRARITDKNSKTPLGYYVSSVGTNSGFDSSNPHYDPRTLLGTCDLGYPNTPYEHDVPLSGLSETGWYCLWNQLNADFNQNEELTFDTSAFYLVVVTDEEGSLTTHYKTAKVRLPAGTYTAFVSAEQGNARPLASLIKTSSDVFVQYYALENREKITFTLASECDVWVSVEREDMARMMIVEGSETTMAYIPYGETAQSSYIKSFSAEEVVGYIPTTGVNGHYEYDELNSDGTNTPGSEDNPGVWVRPFLDEQRNLIQTKQINTFTADGIHKDFYLTENNCGIDKVEILIKTRCKNVNEEDVPTQDEIGTVDEGVSPNTGIRYYYKHIWTEKASNDATYAWSSTNATSSGDPYATKLTFTNIPAAHEENLVNIRVTFSPHEFEYSAETDTGKITKCSVVGKYGYFNNNRFYFSGNPEYKGMDWESGVDDPTYFPANGWTQVGSSDTAIQGYLHYGEELAILKEDNNTDATLYMRSAVVTDDQDVIFPVKQGAQGVGALSKWCLKTLHDEPLFLAKEGVYAIEGTDASQERTVPSRSIFVDVKLRKEATNLCVAETFKDYYILCNPVTKRAFVADWRRSTAQLEWCVWDNIPARVIFATDDQLFFGTTDGRLCVFNTDFTDKKRYLDGQHIDINETDPEQRLDGSNPYTGGEAIHAFYVTKRDHLGSFDFKKTMLNDGGVITLMPMDRSSASITIKTDKGEWFVDSIQTDSDEPSVVIPIRHRTKNFDSIETRIENDKPCEGIALLGVQYRYAITTNRR